MKRGWACWAVVLLIAALVAPPAAAQTRRTTTTDPPTASRKAQIDRQIRSLREQVEEASEREADLLDRLDATEARRRQLEAKVANVDRQIATATEELALATARLEDVDRELRKTEIKLEVAEEQLRDAETELRDRAVAAYVRQPGTEVAGVMLKVRSVRDLSAAVAYLESVVQAQSQTVGDVRSLRDGTEDMRAELQGSRASAADLQQVVLDRKGELEAARQEQDAVRREAAREETRQEHLLDEVRESVAEFEARIAALKAESESITAFLRSIQRGQGIAPSGRGRLAVPVPGRITSGFGLRAHPILGTVRPHTGIDFGAGSGTPIRAAADGVVVSAGTRGGYGTTTIIDHGGSLATLYAHQSRMIAGEGQAVKRGQVIGAVGSTGFSTGPHLHFEVRVAGTPVDPLPYL